jgi:hypothetical protein
MLLFFLQPVVAPRLEIVSKNVFVHYRGAIHRALVKFVGLKAVWDMDGTHYVVDLYTCTNCFIDSHLNTFFVCISFPIGFDQQVAGLHL